MARVRAIAAFLAEHGQPDRARQFAVREEFDITQPEICACSSCREFYRRRPLDGWQLRLFTRAELGEPANVPAGSGSRPDATPLPVSQPGHLRICPPPAAPSPEHADV